MAKANQQPESNGPNEGRTIDPQDRPDAGRETHPQAHEDKPLDARGRELAPQAQGGAVSTQVGDVDFSQDAGRGMEGATQESFAIPFLVVLQKGSPQVDEASGVAIEGARQGMFFENVTGRMFDGKKGVVFVPCAYRRTHVRWGPRGTPGAGFKGELSADEVLKLREEGKIVELDRKLLFKAADGSVNPKTCDRVADTRNHYGLLIDPDDDTAWTHAVLSLVSTQIRKSKGLMSALASVKLKGASGAYTPASWANLVRVTTVPESNDQGSWYGVSFKLEGQVKNHALYSAGKSFNAAVKGGAVDVKYEEDLGGDPTTVDEPREGRGGGSF